MTERQHRHAVGEFELQNNPNCAKFTAPTQLTNLGVLDTRESLLWEYDEKLGLPVVASAEYFGEMYSTYGDPDKNTGGDTIVFPKRFTEDAHGGGHPRVNFSRNDVLAFITSESILTSDFPRLYVGTFDDFEQLAEGGSRAIWGETYSRPAFAPDSDEKVREVFIIPADRGPIRTTRPETEGWACVNTLLSQGLQTVPQRHSSRATDDD